MAEEKYFRLAPGCAKVSIGGPRNGYFMKNKEYKIEDFPANIVRALRMALFTTDKGVTIRRSVEFYSTSKRKEVKNNGR